MDRRHYLASVGSLVLLAGCGGSSTTARDDREDGANPQSPTETSTEGTTATATETKTSRETATATETPRGKTRKLGTALVSVEQTRLRRRLRTGIGFDGDNSYKTPENGGVYLFVRVSIENTGTDAIAAPTLSNFAGVVDGVQQNLPELSTLPDGISGTPAPAYGGGDIVPGARTSVWVCIPVTDGASNVRFVVDPPDNWNGDITSWTIPVDTKAVPELSLTYDVPSKMALDERKQATVSIQNAGGRQGSYQLSITTSDGKEYNLTGTVEPGETVIRTVPITATGIGSYYIRGETEFDPDTAGLKTVGTVEVGPAQATVGDQIRLPTGVTLRVRDLQLADEIVMRPEYAPEETDREQPSDGMQFAAFHARSVNKSDTEQPIPIVSDFKVLADGNGYSEQPDYGGVKQFEQPFSGADYNTPGLSGVVNSGREVSGWVVFEVPDNVNRQNLVVETSFGNWKRKLAALWTVD